MDRAVFLIEPGGLVRGLYTDEIDWQTLGSLRVLRASPVEFDQTVQGWIVTILRSRNVLGPFPRRRDAIDAAVASLTGWLSGPSSEAAIPTDARRP